MTLRIGLALPCFDSVHSLDLFALKKEEVSNSHDTCVGCPVYPSISRVFGRFGLPRRRKGISSTFDIFVSCPRIMTHRESGFFSCTIRRHVRRVYEVKFWLRFDGGTPAEFVHGRLLCYPRAEQKVFISTPKQSTSFMECSVPNVSSLRECVTVRSFDRLSSFRIFQFPRRR